MQHATVFLCVVLKQATLAEAMDPYMSDDMHTTYWFDSALVSGLLIAIIAAAALVAIGYSVQQFVIASRKPTIRLRGGWFGHPATLEPRGNKAFHGFISHGVAAAALNAYPRGTIPTLAVRFMLAQRGPLGKT